MPIYEYQCEACGAVNDIKHGFKEIAQEPCAKCGGIELKRLFNAAGIVFKGSGFYVTDSRKSSGPEVAKTGNAGDSGKASDSGKAGDSGKGSDSGKAGDSGKTGESGKADDSGATGDSSKKSDSGGKGDAAA